MRAILAVSSHMPICLFFFSNLSTQYFTSGRIFYPLLRHRGFYCETCVIPPARLFWPQAEVYFPFMMPKRQPESHVMPKISEDRKMRQKSSRSQNLSGSHPMLPGCQHRTYIAAFRFAPISFWIGLSNLSLSLPTCLPFVSPYFSI